MYNYAKKIREKFKRSCKNVTTNLSKYVKNPNKDFIRKRKLLPLKIIQCVFQFSDHSLGVELIKNNIVISRQAFVKGLNKFKIDAFKEIFNNSLNETPKLKTIHGKRLLAVDGSYFYYLNKLYERIGLLCVMVYDVLNHYYVDGNITSPMSEIKSFLTMLENFVEPVIFVFDKGYSSLNLMAHLINKKQYFVIRTKDIHSTNGLLKKCKFEDKEFDEDYTFHLGRTQKKSYKSLNGYKYIAPAVPFDFIQKNDTTTIYDVCIRVVRIKLSSGKYESLLTNLPRNKYSVEDLKEIYRLRWEIETSFRDLKHTLGALSLHSKEQENIIKELYANLTIYNYVQILRNYSILHEQMNSLLTEQKTKYHYIPRFTYSTAVVKLFFCEKEITEEIFLFAFEKDKIPIRQNRFRKIDKEIESVPTKLFTYRCAA